MKAPERKVTRPKRETKRGWKIQIRDFLAENFEDLLFWLISILIAMFCCLLFEMLIHYQRSYPR